ncbi:hypothetical protein KDL01_27955 [Actinospica durhamensis]|uniref:Uncharacterized protein n=1 Tax=Actinospica durhamensis TaxID=1508375 RepID=A0A941ETV8_9ACTN|nr:hypothetical protein [Actinospica durhamensis]MBR7837143.1 hypothetical protein [Actinospica durhamensis]
MEREIEVVFIDAEGGQAFGHTRLELGTLLERIASPTTFFIHGELWDVEAADPNTHAGLEERGSARLTLRRQQPIAAAAPVGDLRSGMSSLCNALPPMTGQPTVMRAPYLKLHEDVWRDVEFVADGAQPAITRNFSEIAAVLAEAAKQRTAYFGRCAVRAEPAAPLDGVTIGVDELATVLGQNADAAYPVVIDGPPPGRDIPNGLVLGGFAFDIGGGTCVYGRNVRSQIAELGVYRAAGGVPEASRVASALSALMRTHSLSLVDWRARAQLRTAAQITAWLSP